MDSDLTLVGGGGVLESLGRLTSRPFSFTKEVVTIKKISMMNTMSNMGVISIAASSSELPCFFLFIGINRQLG